MKNKILPLALRAFISIGLIVLLLYIMRNRYGQILAVIRGASPGVFLLSFLFFIAAIVVASYRLMLIIEAQEIPITFFETVSLTFIGYFFNNFLPTSIGGDVVKAYYLSKKTSDKMNSYASIFVDRVIGLMTMVFMAFVAVFFVERSIIGNPIRHVIYAITAVSALIILFMANKGFAKKFSVILVLLQPIEAKLRSAYRGVNKYKHHKFLIFQSLVISVISQVLSFISIGFLAYSIGARIPPIAILVRMPIISMMSLLPSINGLGLREGSTVVMFGPLIGASNAFAVSLLWLATLLLTSVIGGIIYGLSPQFKVRIKELEAEV